MPVLITCHVCILRIFFRKESLFFNTCLQNTLCHRHHIYKCFLSSCHIIPRTFLVILDLPSSSRDQDWIIGAATSKEDPSVDQLEQKMSLDQKRVLFQFSLLFCRSYLGNKGIFGKACIYDGPTKAIFDLTLAFMSYKSADRISTGESGRKKSRRRRTRTQNMLR